MQQLRTKDIPYEEVDNGALILLLVRECKTWDELCRRYARADPLDSNNTNTMVLVQKLQAMRDVGLITFQEKADQYGAKLPDGAIRATDLWAKIRVALGGMSLTEAAMVSRHSGGMAVLPTFGRPPTLEEKIDVFVLMPFDTTLLEVYTEHIKKAVERLGLKIRRADEIYSPEPFMTKVWHGICAAEIVLADCTEKKPNVFYEIGIAHTVGKKVILITRSEGDIPSDLGHFEHITYTPEGVQVLASQLQRYLKAHFALRSPAEAGKATGSAT